MFLMKILLIDTATDHNLLALIEGDEIFDHSFGPEIRESIGLIPKIAEICPIDTLDAIAIGIGPGAFTGTRVGIMAAKALAYGANLPLIPFPSLLAFIPTQHGPFTISMDAKAGKFYSLSGTTHPLTYTDTILTDTAGTPLTPNLPTLAKILKSLPQQDPIEVQALYLRNP